MKAQVERADLPGSLSHWPRPSSEATEKGLCVSSGVGRVGSSMQPVVMPEKSHTEFQPGARLLYAANVFLLC